MTVFNILTSLLWFAAMGAALFWPAGTLDWTQACLFLAMMIAGTAVTIAVLARRDPALLRDRLSGPYQKNQSPADKIFMSAMTVIWFAWLVLMALDAQAWRLSHMAWWLNGLGALLFAAGFAGVLRVFRENSFAAPVVKIQQERQQRVIDTGPYAIVRHPMYTSALVYLLGMPLLLGSWLGVAALPVVVAMLLIRIPIEERVLRAGLSGYDAYAARVRFRLVPGVW